jgi:hypothetical protein
VTFLFTCVSETSIEDTGGSDTDDDDDNNNNNNNLNNKYKGGKNFFDHEIYSENLSLTNSSIKISHMVEVASFMNIQKSLNKRL